MREAAAASPTPRRSAIQYGAQGILRSAFEATPYSVLSTVAASENTVWRISVRCSNTWYPHTTSGFDTLPESLAKFAPKLTYLSSGFATHSKPGMVESV